MKCQLFTDGDLQILLNRVSDFIENKKMRDSDFEVYDMVISHSQKLWESRVYYVENQYN